MYYMKPLNSYFEIGKDVVLNELFFESWQMIPVILECEKYDEHVFKKINTKFSQPDINFFWSDLLGNFLLVTIVHSRRRLFFF